MIKTLTLTAAVALGLGGAAMAEAEREIEDFDFSFEGIFGSYDTLQLQRGLKIYTEICSGCHGLEYVAFRTLASENGPALPEEQMREYAARIEVFDPDLFDGEGDFRPATPADTYPGSLVANAPDLSVMAKARAGFEGPYGTGLNQLWYGMGGPEYIASLISGYEEAPACAPEDFPGYYNTAFAAGGYPQSCIDEDGEYLVVGSWIAMAPPLYDEAVEFDDESENDVEAMSADVAAFLMWAAEPGLNTRKTAGLQGVIFLSVLAVLLYLTNKRLWARHKHTKE